MRTRQEILASAGKEKLAPVGTTKK